MATKRDDLAAKLAHLNGVLGKPASAQTLVELRAALAGKSSHLAARAAAGVVEMGRADVGELVGDLAAAFDRFMHDPAKTDKGCSAKTAIVRALSELGAAEHGIYVRACRHVQKEPAYGGPVDTATELRALAAIALINTGHPDALVELVHLLVDPERQPRAAAARALGASGTEAAALLLRLKVLEGEDDPEVLTECFAGLLRLQPGASLALVTGYLKAEATTIADAAALALGGSRLAGALPPLRDAAERCLDPAGRQTLFTAIALHRSAEATAYLLEQVRHAPAARAAEAIAALAVYRNDPQVADQVRAAAAGREEALVAQAVREHLSQ